MRYSACRTFGSIVEWKLEFYMMITFRHKIVNTVPAAQIKLHCQGMNDSFVVWPLPLEHRGPHCSLTKNMAGETGLEA